MSVYVHSFHLHVMYGERLIVCCSCSRSVFLSISLWLQSSLPCSICTLLCIPSFMRTVSRKTSAATSSNTEYCILYAVHPTYRLWTQHSWWLPLLRDLLQASFRSNPERHDVLVLVWRGTRRRDHRQSALFFTSHSEFRRISGYEDKLITSVKKVSCQLSPFLHTHT